MVAWWWLACSGGEPGCTGEGCDPTDLGVDDEVSDTDVEPTDATETDTTTRAAHSAVATHTADAAHSGGEPFDGPVLVTSASVTCAGDLVEVRLETQGWSGGGVFYQIASGDPLVWAEEHDLASYEFDPGGAWDRLGVDLETGASLGGVERSRATTFTCADHYDRPGVLTFAVAALDLYGAVADCRAWGDDPAGVVAGTVLSPYNYASGPSFDPSGCALGVAAR